MNGDHFEKAEKKMRININLTNLNKLLQILEIEE